MRARRWMMVGLALLSWGCGQPKPGATATGSEPALVKVSPVGRALGPSGDRFSATVAAYSRVRLTFNSSGYVHRIFEVAEKDGGNHVLQAGDRVRRSQILAELRNNEYRARLGGAEASLGQAVAGERNARADIGLAQAQTRQARGRLTEAESAVHQAQAQQRELQAALRAGQAQLSQAEAQARKSREDWERARNLFQADSLTKPDYESARLADQVAAAQWAQARQQVEQLRARLAQSEAGVSAARARAEQARGQVDAGRAQEEKAQAGVGQAQAQIRAAQASVEQADVALGDIYLKAPMDGVILTRGVEVGAQVSPGALGFEMADTSRVRVAFGVPDTLVRQLKLGQTMQIRAEAMPGKVFSGTVETISPEADPQSRVYRVEVKVPNSQDQLKVGMIATLDLTGPGTGKSQMTVPLGALQPSQSQPDGYQVLVVEGGKARARQVKVGAAVGDQMEILEGLTPDSQVIVEGANLVSDGEPVRVSE